ncbi:hypothetical protein CRG98_040210 [Punica granatum]|uniref:Uncharacterized protein n=1 Tax=Punica granatum TaxID=22663 RepID=A0A2I0I5R7_PUNGR|nr:hypothetical protein CRG98_040210 [Punica granatum]
MPEVVTGFGPWMHVQGKSRKSRQEIEKPAITPNVEPTIRGRESGNGLRFAVLLEEDLNSSGKQPVVTSIDGGVSKLTSSHVKPKDNRSSQTGPERAVKGMEQTPSKPGRAPDPTGTSSIILVVHRPSVEVATHQESNPPGLMEASTQDGSTWALTMVYASPTESSRRDLWQLLRDLSSRIQGPWMVIGDFNEILEATEKMGGAPFDPNPTISFQEALDHAGLMDLGSTGALFTWRGPLFQGYDRVFKRLDRAVCNTEWHILFPEVTIHVLPRVKSDHHPLWLNLQSNQGRRHGIQPFRYIDARRSHPDFNQVLETAWDNRSRLLESLAGFKEKINKWNKEALKNSNDDWITEDEQLSRHAIDHFRGLFTEESVSPNLGLPNYFSREAISDFQALVRLASSEEVRSALLALGPYKAPVPDDFPSIFFQAHWTVVEPSIMEFVLFVIDKGMSVSNVNDTLLVLIPKVELPESIHQFRPINICNVSYKLITKVIVNRLQGYMAELVSPNQKLRVIIRDCISSVGMNVLWNGSLTEGFKPGRGIRQGCPLSPYLFVLSVERLSHLIRESVEAKVWQPMRVGQNGLWISHLMFADDILLFAKASENQIATVCAILDRFCAVSREKVSASKTVIYFSQNVEADLRERICTISSFGMSSTLGRYLGVPIVHGRLRREHFEQVVSRVQDKINGWTARTLSMAGRITLAKSMIQAIPSFTMQVMRLPANVCEQLHRHCCDFIWGHSSDSRKIHLVNW